MDEVVLILGDFRFEVDNRLKGMEHGIAELKATGQNILDHFSTLETKTMEAFDNGMYIQWFFPLFGCCVIVKLVLDSESQSSA